MAWIGLGIGTVLIVLFSWFVSIRDKRYHGVARFFSFESILLLGLLNGPVWFRDPLSHLQVLSWIFLIVSAVLAAWALVLFFRIGKPKGSFENTTKLVTTGLYGVIRHPMYASLFYLGTGVWLKDINAVTTNLALLNLLAVLATMKIEEGEMIARFGGEYRSYMKRTKKFMPYIV